MNAEHIPNIRRPITEGNLLEEQPRASWGFRRLRGAPAYTGMVRAPMESFPLTLDSASQVTPQREFRRRRAPSCC
jgi:hypothetical protein